MGLQEIAAEEKNTMRHHIQWGVSVIHLTWGERRCFELVSFNWPSSTENNLHLHYYHPWKKNPICSSLRYIDTKPYIDSRGKEILGLVNGDSNYILSCWVKNIHTNYLKVIRWLAAGQRYIHCKYDQRKY